jgi:hypothetical protein
MPVAGTGFKGLVDEFRVARLVRSAEWLRVEYQSGLSDSTLVSFGEEEAGQGSGSG